MARTGIPPVTRLFLFCLCVCSVLTFVLRYSAYLHLVSAQEHDEDHEHLINEDEETAVPLPSEIYVPLIALVTGDTSALLLRPWTLFTSAFIEDGVFAFALAFALILYTGRYIEALWGSREFLYYLTTNVLVGNIVAYLVYGLKSMASEDEVVQITGASAIIIALLVAIKQRIPNHYLLFLNGFIRLKVSFVPFLVLIGGALLSLLIPSYNTVVVLNWTGFMTSWIFLRFWKEGGSGRQLAILPIAEATSGVQLAMKGDRTSQFALVTFFPYPLTILVSFVCDKCFELLCHFKMLDRSTFTNDDLELGNSSTSPQVLSLSSNSTQSDIISTMSQSRIVTSSSLAGVSGMISPLSFPKGSVLQKMSDKVFTTFGGHAKREVDVNLDKRRKLALMQLDSKLGDGTL